MLPVPFLVVNDDIMTSLLLLKVIYMLANFLILFNPLLFKYLSLNVFLEGNVDSADKFNNVTSDYIILSIKLSPEVGNDEIIFGGHSMSGFEVIEGGPLEPSPPPPAGSEKSPVIFNENLPSQKHYHGSCTNSLKFGKYDITFRSYTCYG